LIFLNNPLPIWQSLICCLKRKNRFSIFSFQSMPNLQFWRRSLEIEL
jgi:hypothetical protein